MADEKRAPAPLSVPVKAESEAERARPLNGVAVKAPAGMESISVGGLNFAREGDGFVLPAPLVAAAKAHIQSFIDAAGREEKRMMAELKRLAAEADIPGRIKALEQRLADLEGGLGRGPNRG
ncbi:MAG: hypothetical protein ACREF0_21500 [Acetobacteraceae bacterium]